MTLNFVTTPKDYMVLLNRILAQSILGKSFSKFARIAISVLAWMSVILPFIKFHEIGIGFWLRTVLAVSITIGWPYFYNKYTDGVFSGIINDKTLAGYAGKVNVNISEEFVEAITKTTISKSSRSDIHSIEINNTHIFIFFTPIIAAPIPLAAFKNPNEKNEFLKEIERHKKLLHL